MDKDLKEFIQAHINLIDNNEFEKLYDAVTNSSYTYDMKDLSLVFLQAEINPLDYMTYVPENFLAGSDIESFEIPEGVKIIRDFAFADCTLQNITIPSSVTNIGSEVLGNSLELTDINYNGTEAQWNSIKKDPYWSDGTSSFIVHCSDGDIEM